MGVTWRKHDKHVVHRHAISYPVEMHPSLLLSLPFVFVRPCEKERVSYGVLMLLNQFERIFIVNLRLRFLKFRLEYFSSELYFYFYSRGIISKLPAYQFSCPVVRPHTGSFYCDCAVELYFWRNRVLRVIFILRSRLRNARFELKNSVLPEFNQMLLFSILCIYMYYQMYLFSFIICPMNFQHDSFETVSTYRNMANVAAMRKYYNIVRI